jgi:hypothetical protein
MCRTQGWPFIFAGSEVIHWTVLADGAKWNGMPGSVQPPLPVDPVADVARRERLATEIVAVGCSRSCSGSGSSSSTLSRKTRPRARRLLVHHSEGSSDDPLRRGTTLTTLQPVASWHVQLWRLVSTPRQVPDYRRMLATQPMTVAHASSSGMRAPQNIGAIRS